MKFINLILIIVLLIGCKNEQKLTIQPRIISSEKFGDIAFYKPDNFEKVVIFFSPETNNNQKVSLLLENKVAVFLVNPRPFMESMAADKDQCNVVGADIERLDQSLQNTLKFGTFMKPYLVGIGDGALLSFIAQIQSPDRFQGSLSDQICSRTKVKFCDTDSFRYVPSGELFELQLTESDREWENFFVSFEDATDCKNPQDLTALTGVEQFDSETQQKLTDMLEKSATADDSDAIYELFTETSRPVVVFVSGDGGWADIDQQTAEVLQQRGYNVLGVSALKYFWQKKSPEETAEYINGLISEYSHKWNSSEVILLGFSLGANAVPLIYNRIPEDLKNQTSSVILLAPEEATDLEVHISDWLGIDTKPEDLILLDPEIRKIPAAKVLCIYGEEEESSACKNLKNSAYKTVKLSGGHHFDQDYKHLGQIVADFIKSNIKNHTRTAEIAEK